MGAGENCVEAVALPSVTAGKTTRLRLNGLSELEKPEQCNYEFERQDCAGRSTPDR